MLHWIPKSTTAFVGARSDSPRDVDDCVRSLRAMHALMLAYAGQRRRAAVDTAGASYWKAAESHALDKARAIRTSEGFGRLP